ncbi:MAG: TetR/AcrR family transcriptional regulator [Actinomycetota bacterium]
MPTPPPRSQRPTQADRREASARRLLNAAIEHFADNGFARTTAADIAATAGYSREMVRTRFGSKQEILEVLLREHFENVLIYPANTTDAGLDQILERIDRLVRLHVESPQLLQAILTVGFEAPSADPWLTARMGDWFTRATDRIAELVVLGHADRSVRVELDPQHEALSFVSECTGLCFGFMVGGTGPSFEVLLRAWRQRVEQHLSGSISRP